MSDTKAKKETKQVKRSEAGSVVGGASSSASGTTVIREEFFLIFQRQIYHQK